MYPKDHIQRVTWETDALARPQYNHTPYIFTIFKGDWLGVQTKLLIGQKKDLYNILIIWEGNTYFQEI